ncbi:hypothetical protein PUNSTDRAFT_132261 [Punctularia strigosozonata HHB-11173 SS5]|uniref:uncharacterized protein n=1 Tax=Punctularia strigosozonata (strain HHB-11173) TaxID=741275 RepID=UPI00044186C8|nr:uncharacterized protein PUNSTDRAFT_132261 [Punctularia strigosozonata HHB-11173 SS5]EIN10156.1 hypothetical protein PUNSTDRAFT_132261 [Punctularia strigosozonata HHB-11173 SS5]
MFQAVNFEHALEFDLDYIPQQRFDQPSSRYASKITRKFQAVKLEHALEFDLDYIPQQRFDQVSHCERWHSHALSKIYSSWSTNRTRRGLD